MKKKQQVQLENEKKPDFAPRTVSQIFFPLFIKASLLAALIAFILLFLTAVGAVSLTWHRAQKIAARSGYDVQAIISQVKQGWSSEPISQNGVKNILVLGLDSLETRPGSPPLADTILIASLNLHTGSITLISLPRDLWSNEYQTKINALYVYGKEKNPAQPAAFPTQVISEMTGLPIHHTLVLTMENVAEFIDSVGGISILVPTGFVDPLFPRPDVDVTTQKDPEVLYKTISFEAGEQQMDGARALEYMRSRHSEDESGTDIARSQRQQLVITSLAQKLLKKETLLNESNLTALLTLYKNVYEPVFPITEVVATAKKIYPLRQQIAIATYTPSIFPDDDQGLISHPPIKNANAYNGQWVYIIRDPQTFKTTLKTLVTLSTL